MNMSIKIKNSNQLLIIILALPWIACVLLGSYINYLFFLI